MTLSKNHPHIYHNEREITNSVGEIWKVGWYFADETEWLNGPYNTESKAFDQFKLYCERYL